MTTKSTTTTVAETYKVNADLAKSSAQNGILKGSDGQEYKVTLYLGDKNLNNETKPQKFQETAQKILAFYQNNNLLPTDGKIVSVNYTSREVFQKFNGQEKKITSSHIKSDDFSDVLSIFKKTFPDQISEALDANRFSRKNKSKKPKGCSYVALANTAQSRNICVPSSAIMLGKLILKKGRNLTKEDLNNVIAKEGQGNKLYDESKRRRDEKIERDTKLTEQQKENLIAEQQVKLLNKVKKEKKSSTLLLPEEICDENRKFIVDNKNFYLSNSAPINKNINNQSTKIIKQTLINFFDDIAGKILDNESTYGMMANGIYYYALKVSKDASGNISLGFGNSHSNQYYGVGFYVTFEGKDAKENLATFLVDELNCKGAPYPPDDPVIIKLAEFLLIEKADNIEEILIV